MAEQLTDLSVLFAPCLGHPNHTSSPLPASIAPQGIGQGIGAALAQARQSPRAALPFRAVNQRDKPGYDPGMQRHHLLPNQVLSARCFGHFFDEIGRGRVGFDDFRSNGLLLPASDACAVRIGLPLHRGPHREYNQMVLERVGQVEEGWSALRLRAPEIALDEALLRLKLLQGALRRRLLEQGRKRLTLNRFDPLGREADFSQMDEMVDALWPATEPALNTPINEAELALILPAGGRDRMRMRAGNSAFSF